MKIPISCIKAEANELVAHLKSNNQGNLTNAKIGIISSNEVLNELANI